LIWVTHFVTKSLPEGEDIDLDQIRNMVASAFCNGVFVGIMMEKSE